MVSDAGNPDSHAGASAPTPLNGTSPFNLKNVYTISLEPNSSLPVSVLATGTTTTSGIPPVSSGDTATIGFWANKNGQALIKSLNGGPTSTALANWLATNFPHLYGNLAGKTNADVAALDLAFKGVSGMKTDAQILGNALAIYVTDSTLNTDPTLASKYGFNSSPGGTGAKTYNVGSNGTAIGLSNNTSYTIFFLLQQADLQKAAGTFDANAWNTIADGINQLGDIK